MKNVVVGRGRTVRLGPWRGRPGVASVSTYIDQPIDDHAVADIIERLCVQGYKKAVTAALLPQEQVPFARAGFGVERQLVLLKRPLDQPVPKAEQRLRRWRRRRLDQVLDIDHAAFDDFWAFDEIGLREALDATPQRLLRVDTATPPTGYALSGVSRDRAYLQRLAVHPGSAGTGLGTALLLDALRWMRWRGADQVYVNTQDDNERALALYERNGFVPEPGGLAILSKDLP